MRLPGGSSLRPTTFNRLLTALGALVVLAVFIVWKTYPNYDTYYALVWGQEIISGELPDYSVFRTPTPHPLSTAVGALMATFGTAADRLMVLIGLFSLLGFYIVAFCFCKRLLGGTVALACVGVLLFRTDIQLLALRATFDLPFYLMIFGAALVELRRPRCGWPVLLVLAFAGLLRPEAWLFAGAYWLYIGWKDRAGALQLIPLVVIAPIIWLTWDFIVTGQPLYSLTSTREVSDAFGRNRGALAALTNIPQFMGGNDRVVTIGLGGLGLLLGVYILRARAALPLAIAIIGTLTFLMIATAGLSVIPRYLTIPSLLLTLCAGITLAGFTQVDNLHVRRVAIGLAVLAAGVMVWRAQYLIKDVARVKQQANFIERQHRGLLGVLDSPRVVAALQSCRPITTPTHSPIPIIRFRTGMGKELLQASIGQDAAPTEGLQFVSDTYNFEPSSGRTLIARANATARKHWSNRPLPDFKRIGRRGSWKVYAKCGIRP